MLTASRGQRRERPGLNSGALVANWERRFGRLCEFAQSLDGGAHIALDRTIFLRIISLHPVPRDRGVSDQRLQTRGGERWPGNEVAAEMRCPARRSKPREARPPGRWSLGLCGVRKGRTPPKRGVQSFRRRASPLAVGKNCLPTGVGAEQTSNTARGTPLVWRTCGYSDFDRPRCREASRSAGPSGPLASRAPSVLSRAAAWTTASPAPQRIRAAERWLFDN